jgi:exopolysaccharide biosynthesis WecB/TagA/CpsF family protein
LAWHSSDFAACLVDSNVLLRDGIGIEACLAVLGQTPGRNMNGTDFIPKLTAAFAGRRIAIYGTTEPWTSKAADALAASGCRVVGTMDGFRPDSDYVAEAVRTSPDLIILAMGNPKQEIVARMIAASVIDPTVIVNGGAIADFLAQRFDRAPVWLRRARCEWLFRILQEPGRLWRRYLLGGFAFARSVVLLRMVSR